MTRPKTSISKRLSAASVFLANAAGEPEIATALAEYGIDEARLASARALVEAAAAAVSRQVAANGEYRVATTRCEAAEEAARATYQALAQVARASAGRDAGTLTLLGLDRPMPRRLPLLLTMSAALFDNAVATPEVAARLARYAYTPARLTAERQRINELSEALRAKEAARGAAQQATVAQDAAVDAVDAEMSALRRVAKVALRQQAQSLEKLGILARSSPTAAQRRARATRRKPAPAPASA